MEEIPKVMHRQEQGAMTYLFSGLAVLALVGIALMDFHIHPLLISAAGLAILTGLFVLGLQDSFPILLALTIYIPFSKILPGDFGGHITALNLTNLLMVLAAMSWIATLNSRGGRFWTRTSVDKPLFILCFFAIFSLVRSGESLGILHMREALFDLKRWMDPILIYFIFTNLIRTKEEVKTIIRVILVIVFVTALMGIKEHYFDRTGSSWESLRILGITEQSNTLGSFYVNYMFLFAGLLLTNISTMRYWVFAIPFLVCVRSLIFTGSRGAYIAFAVGLLGLCLARSKTLFIVSATVLLLLTTIFSKFLPETVQYNFQRTFEAELTVGAGTGVAGSLETSAASRVEIWKGGLQMIREHPLVGTGFGAFPFFISQYISDASLESLHRRDAHNTYLLIAAEMGLPAFIAFLVVLGAIFRMAWQVYRNTEDPFLRGIALGFIAGFIGLLTANIFGSRFNSNSFEMVGYFWVLAAMMSKLRLLEGGQDPDAL